MTTIQPQISQLREIQARFLHLAQTLEAKWPDEVGTRYFEQFVRPYSSTINLLLAELEAIDFLFKNAEQEMEYHRLTT